MSCGKLKEDVAGYRVALMLHLNGLVAIVSELVFSITGNHYDFAGGARVLCGDKNFQILRLRCKILKFIWKIGCDYAIQIDLPNQCRTHRLLLCCSNCRCYSRPNHHFARAFFLLIWHFLVIVLVDSWKSRNQNMRSAVPNQLKRFK